MVGSVSVWALCLLGGDTCLVLVGLRWVSAGTALLLDPVVEDSCHLSVFWPPEFCCCASSAEGPLFTNETPAILQSL